MKNLDVRAEIAKQGIIKFKELQRLLSKAKGIVGVTDGIDQIDLEISKRHRKIKDNIFGKQLKITKDRKRTPSPDLPTNQAILSESQNDEIQ